MSTAEADSVIRNASIARGRNEGAATIASGRAPVLYFDTAPISGLSSGGVAHITLEALLYASPETGQKADRHFVVVGHLRADLAALASLKRAIEDIERLATVDPKATRN